MKKDTDTMLKIYQIRRQLSKVHDDLVWKVERQKGVGEKIGAPIYAAQCQLGYVDGDLEFMLDRWEGYLPPDVDDDGEPYSDDELTEEIRDRLNEALQDLNQFKRKNEIVEEAKTVIIGNIKQITNLLEAES